MEVNAINGVSRINFEGRSSKKDRKAGSMGYAQMDAPASKKSSNAMKTLLYSALLAGAVGTTASCSKDDWIGSSSSASANAVANAWYTPVCPEYIHDTAHIYHIDTVEVPGPTQHIIDTVKVPVEKIVHDTTWQTKLDTVYVPQIVHDTLTQTKTDTVYVPKVDTVYVPKVDTVYVPKIEHDTITVEVPKYIVEHDTIVNTIIQPINVKSAPWNVIDSLINQGLNVGIPLEGPKPNTVGENHVLFLGSRAYNEYDYKLYETQLDNIGTNGDGNGDGTLCLVSKITDDYKNEVQYMKTNVVIIPGEGLKLTRYVMSEADAAAAKKNNGTGLPSSDAWQWNYAGYEIRHYDRNGVNTTTVYDKAGRFMSGEIIKGNEPGEFLYGRVVYDNNGNPYVDEETGEYEKAYYDFSKGKMWSTEVKKVEGDFTDFTWG